MIHSHVFPLRSTDNDAYLAPVSPPPDAVQSISQRSTPLPPIHQPGRPSSRPPVYIAESNVLDVIPESRREDASFGTADGATWGEEGFSLGAQDRQPINVPPRSMTSTSLDEPDFPVQVVPTGWDEPSNRTAAAEEDTFPQHVRTPTGNPSRDFSPNFAEQTASLDRSRKRRVGWWDGTPNRSSEMEHIKAMLRKAPIIIDAESEDADVEFATDYNDRRSSLGQSGTESEDYQADVSMSSNRMIVSGKAEVLEQIRPLSPKVLRQGHSASTLIGGSEDAGSRPTSANGEKLLRRPSVGESTRREKQLRSKVNQLQGKIQHLENMAGKYSKVLKQISSLERMPASEIPTSQAMQILLRYCQDNRLRHTAEALRKESMVATKLFNHMKLRRYLERKECAKAVAFVQHVMVDVVGNAPARQKLANSFDDLMYVLNKYYFICQVEKDHAVAARQVLEASIRPHVDRERAKPGRRGEWFATDYELLSDLLRKDSNRSIDNIYASFNWDRELGLFWGSARRAHELYLNPEAKREDERIPLYAHAVAEWFLSEDVDEDMSLQSLAGCKEWRDGVLGCLKEAGIEIGMDGQREEEQVIPVERVSQAAEAEVADGEGIQSVGDHEEPDGNEDAPSHEPISQPAATDILYSNHKIPEAESVVCPQSQPQPQPQAPRTRPAPPNTSKPPAAPTYRSPPTMERTLRHAASTPVLRAVSVASNQTGTSLGSNSTAARLRRSKRESFSGGLRPVLSAKSDAEDAERSPAFPTLIETDKLPPVPLEQEAADFALSSTCGPVLGQVRALDVRDIPDTGQIIAATAGGDDRTDKRISLFDVRSGTLLSQLDNGTSKAILQLAFHPTREEWLLSADMEFDVKLWDWKSGKLLKVWKKHHSRIVNKICWVPGSEFRAASCSTDQSVKLWDITVDKPVVSSVHANEPFTNFVFCGEGEERQKLVASLSYCIRIYKVRTMAMVGVVQLGELRTNKTPITALCVHPVHDNYILVSCDNQLRLIDIVTETTIKVYSAREIADGTRIEGQFSPFGTFIYSGTSDTRAFLTSRKRNSLLPGDDPSEDDDIANGTTAPKATGVYIWRVHTGRLERSEMRALESSSGGRIGVGVCKWIVANDASRPPNEVRRKVLVAAGLDRTIRMYM
ncbi:hypothetical protein HK097_002811 [Rhizophlyctis rosea]|uniref:Uncharacterized protein n=1 Tax=Rhizophlyctis rosea TaxID=64517 RepID=A0AAD5SH07_9FUNG|nr:hypothetical protein HK097_002811 [Rhizophlyctis rosea]